MTLLKAVTFVIPATAMAAAHWFPWRRIFKSELHRLIAYAIGTTAIVGTAAVAMSVSDGDRRDHRALLLLAALGAGVTTLMAYTIDKFVDMRARLVAAEAREKVLADDDIR